MTVSKLTSSPLPSYCSSWFPNIHPSLLLDQMTHSTDASLPPEPMSSGKLTWRKSLQISTPKNSKTWSNKCYPSMPMIGHPSMTSWSTHGLKVLSHQREPFSPSFKIERSKLMPLLRRTKSQSIVIKPLEEPRELWEALMAVLPRKSSSKWRRPNIPLHHQRHCSHTRRSLKLTLSSTVNAIQIWLRRLSFSTSETRSRLNAPPVRTITKPNSSL